MHKLIKLKDKADSILLLFISFSFVFKISLSTPAILVLLISSFINKSINTNKIILYFVIVFSGIYILYISSVIIDNFQNPGILSKSLGLLFIPLLFYLKKFTGRELIYFTGSFLVLQVIHILYIDIVLVKNIAFGTIDNFENFNALVEKTFIVYRPYFALNCLLAILCIKYLLDYSNIKKVWLLLLLPFIIISLFIIAARLAMGISLLLGILLLIQNKKIISVIAIAVLAGIIIFSSKYTRERIAIEKGEPRIVIWKCAANIINDKEFNFITGLYSSNKVDDKLWECYNSKEVLTGPYWWVKDINYNTHNQFLWYFISYGIIGVLLFLLVFILHGINFIKNKNIFSLMFVMVFFSQSLFENIMVRQLGIYVFLWFSSIFLILPAKSVTNNE